MFIVLKERNKLHTAHVAPNKTRCNKATKRPKDFLNKPR